MLTQRKKKKKKNPEGKVCVFREIKMYINLLDTMYGVVPRTAVSKIYLLSIGIM